MADTIDTSMGAAESAQGMQNQEGTPAAASAQENPESKKQEGRTYTEAELQEAVAKAQQEWDAQKKEDARRAKLSPEDKAKEEAAARQKEIEDLKAQLLRRDLRDEALKTLEREELPAGLADLLDYSSKEAAEKSMQQTQEIFKASLAAALKDRLRGKTPEGLGQAAHSENMLRDQIAKNIRGGLM